MNENSKAIKVEFSYWKLFFVFLALYILVDMKVSPSYKDFTGDLISLETSEYSESHWIATMKSDEKEEDVQFRVGEEMYSFLMEQEMLGKSISVQIDKSKNAIERVDYTFFGRIAEFRVEE